MSGFVYAMEVAGFNLLKIGHTGVPDRRIHTLSGGCPAPVRLKYLIELRTAREATVVERWILLQLAEHRSHGEWVRDVPDVHKVFASIEGAKWHETPGDFHINPTRPLVVIDHEEFCRQREQSLTGVVTFPAKRKVSN